MTREFPALLITLTSEEAFYLSWVLRLIGNFYHLKNNFLEYLTIYVIVSPSYTYFSYVIRMLSDAFKSFPDGRNVALANSSSFQLLSSTTCFVTGTSPLPCLVIEYLIVLPGWLFFDAFSCDILIFLKRQHSCIRSWEAPYGPSLLRSELGSSKNFCFLVKNLYKCKHRDTFTHWLNGRMLV